MPNRNWSGHLAALILLVGVIWISLWGLLDFRKSKLEADEAYQNYKGNTYTEQHKAAEQIANECAISGAPLDFVKECLADRIESYGNQDTTDQDLKAQQDMAFWAKWMVVVGVIGIPLSILGLVTLLVSLAQTRRAISNDREIGHAQIRAYVQMQDVHIVPSAHPKDANYRIGFHFVIVFVNTGTSPAHNLWCAREASVERADIIPPPLPANTENIGTSVGSGGNRTPPEYFVDMGTLDRMVEGRDLAIFITARADYEDIFGKKQFTEVCLRGQLACDKAFLRASPIDTRGMVNFDLVGPSNKAT